MYNFKIKSFIVQTKEMAQKVATDIIDDSQWVSITPLLDDQWEITVKKEKYNYYLNKFNEKYIVNKRTQIMVIDENAKLKYTYDHKIVNTNNNSSLIIAELNQQISADEADCIGQLMATAPKLLNALENLLSWCDDSPDFENEPCIVEAREVVDEAKGEN